MQYMQGIIHVVGASLWELVYYVVYVAYNNNNITCCNAGMWHLKQISCHCSAEKMQTDNGSYCIA